MDVLPSLIIWSCIFHSSRLVGPAYSGPPISGPPFSVHPFYSFLVLQRCHVYVTSVVSDSRP